MKGLFLMNKKKEKKTPFQIITQVVVWLMLIFAVGAVFLGAVGNFL